MLSHPNPINPPHAPFGSFDATVLDADSRVWIFMMHGRIQKILSGGGVYFSYFTEGSADLASLSKHLDPRGPTSSRGCH